MPAVSVIIPTYNCGRYLGASLESILAQTDADLEVVVVDDGSTDETPAVLDAYAGRVRVVRGPHGGMAAARNLGLAHAAGEWIAFHDADDLALPDRVAVLRGALRERPDVDAVFADGARMDDSDRRLVPREIAAHVADRPLGFADLFDGFPVYFQTALVPRRAFAAAGEFDTGIRTQPDLEYGYRLLAHCRAAWIDRVVFHYRWHDTNTTRDRLEVREDLARILERLPSRVPQAVREVGARRVARRLARHHFRIGELRLARGDLGVAGAAFSRAAALRPLDPRYQWMRLRMRLRTGAGRAHP
ncbi:MAG: glycosyltransferase family 2 protein [Candidatus Binatia bacterium]